MSLGRRIVVSFARNISPVSLPDMAALAGGYSFWQRVLASFLRVRLPRPAQAADSPSVRAPVRRGVPISPLSSWFALPTLRVAPTLNAGTAGALVTMLSPDGTAEYFIHRSPSQSADFRLEVVARDDDRLPAVVEVRFTAGNDAVGVLLIVPLVRPRYGPAVGQVELPGFRADGGLEATNTLPIAQVEHWLGDVVTASVDAAASRATIKAWSELRESVPADVAAMIGRALS
jgi:hypothetical protein